MVEAMIPYTARLLKVLLTALILSVHIVAGAADNWPQFRGSRAASRTTIPPARHVERDGANRWKSTPRAGWSRAVWGDQVLSRPPSHRGTRRSSNRSFLPGRSVGGPCFPRNRLFRRPVPLGRLGHRFRRKLRWQACSYGYRRAETPEESYASKLPDRRRARVVYSGTAAVRVRHDGKPVCRNHGTLKCAPMGPAASPSYTGSRLIATTMTSGVIAA